MVYRFGGNEKDKLPKQSPDINGIIDCSIESHKNSYLKGKGMPIVHGRYYSPIDIHLLGPEPIDKFKEKVNTTLKMFTDSDFPIREFKLDLSRMCLTFAESGVEGVMLLNWDKNRFNTTETTGDGAAIRAAKLIAALGSNLQFISDRSIRKFLKGEVKIEHDEYIKILLAQSLQNRIQNGGK